MGQQQTIFGGGMAKYFLRWQNLFGDGVAIYSGGLVGKTKLRVHGKNILGGWVEKIEGGVAKIFLELAWQIFWGAGKKLGGGVKWQKMFGGEVANIV